MKSDTRPFTLLTNILGVGRDDHIQTVLECNSRQIDWEHMLTLANIYSMTPALWCALNDRHLLRHVPEQIAQYLLDLYSLNTTRNHSLRKQAFEAIRQLNEAGIAPVLLKGAVCLFDETRDSGERIMTDLDILVQKSELTSAIAALGGIGYQANPEDIAHYANHHHYAPLYRTGDYGAIELHHELLLKQVSHYLPTEDAFAQARIIEVENIRFRILSADHAVLHNFIHSQIVDRCHATGCINLRSINDLVKLACHHPVNWEEIRTRMRRHGQHSTLQAYLKLASGVLNMDRVKAADAGLEASLHLLRCRLRIESWLYQSIDNKLQRFSRYHIIRRYHCQDSGVSLLAGRLRYITDLLLNRAAVNGPG